VSEPSTGMMVTSNVRLLRPLGEGGMGSVWVAEHLSLRTHVVVKFMARDLARSPEAMARFSREAAAASQVKSPHVVQMFDHGVTGGGAPYIVMELLEGRDLAQQIDAAGRVDPRQVVAIVAQLARAMGKAHERGIMHRDIKPSNVFLCDAGAGEVFVKLLDFGIAKGAGAEGGVGIVGSTTRTGSFIGSPFYMSPEQVVGSKAIDFKTDLWSLGVVVYEALTGDKPFFAETVGALALKIHRDPIPLPSEANRALGAAVDVWFAKACAREPADRFASAREMADALAVALTGEGIAASTSGARVDPAGAAALGAGFATTQAAAPVRSSEPSVIDVVTNETSDNGSGIGPIAGERLLLASHGKWALVAAIAAAAVGAGWLVPRLWAAPVPPAVALPSADPRATPSLASADPASSPPVLPQPVLPQPLPPVLASTAALVAPVTAALPAPSTGAPPALRAAKPRAAASAVASVLPSATASAPAPAASVARPPRGSDDDIK
jgi:serine/threonine protein kinase